LSSPDSRDKKITLIVLPTQAQIEMLERERRGLTTGPFRAMLAMQLERTE
jgi:hypothetical protein